VCVRICVCVCVCVCVAFIPVQFIKLHRTSGTRTHERVRAHVVYIIYNSRIPRVDERFNRNESLFRAAAAHGSRTTTTAVYILLLHVVMTNGPTAAIAIAMRFGVSDGETVVSC